MDSRTMYGSGTPTAYELGLYPKGRRAYGLRSANSLDGYYPAGGRATSRKAKPEPITPERAEAQLRLAQANLMRQLQREHEREQAERREAYLASVRKVEVYV